MKRFEFFGSYNSFRPFIFTVNSGADSQFTIPTFYLHSYNYSIKTEDGQDFNNVTTAKTLYFPNTNTNYDIEIRGVFPAFIINANAESLKVIYIKQFGDVYTEYLDSSLYGCTNLKVIASDRPFVAPLTHINRAFSYTGLTDLYPMDLSYLEQGNNLYTYSTSLVPVAFPNLENLVDGQSMFSGCTRFNPVEDNPLLENLVYGSNMFRDAYSFVGNDYDPSYLNLVEGNSMHQHNGKFDPHIFSTKLSALVNGAYMFYNCSKFNPSNFEPVLSSLVDGTAMFSSCKLTGYSFIQDDPTKGSVNLQAIGRMFFLTEIIEIRLIASEIVYANEESFYCPFLKILILIQMSSSFWINNAPILLGLNIDNLFNSIADISGLPTKFITVSSTQYESGIDTSIATDKGWTIIIV